jgi:hypothetical protein
MPTAHTISALKHLLLPYMKELPDDRRAFFGALTYVESGPEILAGKDPQGIVRREPAVFRHLCMVTAGFESTYGSIDASEIKSEIWESLQAKAASYHAGEIGRLAGSVTLELLDLATVRDVLDFSSSWGFLQVMGYHVIEWDGTTLEDLRNPYAHYSLAQRLMDSFVLRWKLNRTVDFVQMARCWNTGNPNGTTWDARYVPNVLEAMQLWPSL